MCAYRVNAPQTGEGWEAWDLTMRCQSQMRVGFSGPYGFDFSSFFMMADALGYDRGGLAELLPAIEAGALTGMEKRRPRDGD